MSPYICVTYAHEDQHPSDLFCRGLLRYGFRFCCIDERPDSEERREILIRASLLIALTSPAAARAETVAADIRHALERGMQVLCVSLLDNELDHRFCTGTAGGAVLIPFPTDDTPDRHTTALFVHRLFVRHLARLGECFDETACADNVYGQLILCACYAHGGDYDACFELGRAYELGLGVPALEKEAAIWLRRAAEQDVLDALIRMGHLYLLGQGADRDPDQAFAYFTRAAELGDIRGIYHRGLCYLEGHGVMKDPIHAVECLKTAARARHVPSMYQLALLYRDGIGTNRNPRVALHYLRTVCGEGYACGDGYAYREEEPYENAPARRVMPPMPVYRHLIPHAYTCITMRQMRRTRLNKQGVSLPTPASRGGSQASVDYSFGRNTIRARDLPEDRWSVALSTLVVADGETNGHVDSYDIYEEDWTRADAARAASTLGDLLACGSPEDGLRPSPTRALVWYRYAARLGHTEALYALGDAYRRGYGTPTNTGRAVELFRLAAESGSRQGRFAYAVCCERGIGMAENHREAFRLYQLAAEDNYPPAQNNLGGCYEFGVGTSKNMTAAVEYYAAAANAGLADGQCRLGICYELGRGVPADPDKAFRLYELAGEQNHAYALYRRALCYDRGGSLASLEEGGPLPTLSATRPYETEISPLREGERRVEPPYREHTAPARAEDSRFSMDHTRAADLYRRAADLGIPEAAYAFYLCHRLERGLVRDDHDEIHYLRMAAEGNCLQAAYELGLCYMEGWDVPKDQLAAVGQFARAAELWRAQPRDTTLTDHLTGADSLPPDAFSPRQAAGGALYMLAYCALYGLDEEDTARKSRPLDPRDVPTAERIARATPLLREAAALDHVGSLVMLGDLYAYGLLESDGVSSEEEAASFYNEAARAKTSWAETARLTRGAALRDRTDNVTDALMGLAERALDAPPPAPSPDGRPVKGAWKYLSECSAQGSADALVVMAECLYHGRSAAPNQQAAFRLLRRAEAMDGGRITAALWLGDVLCSRWGEYFNPDEADSVYRRGLKYPCKESENGPYTLGLRRVDRKRADVRARAEILYRLAILRAMYFSTDKSPRESFLYLAEAILMGHGPARDDLARIFAYENPRSLGSSNRNALGGRRGRHRAISGRKARLRRRMMASRLRMSHLVRTRRHRQWLNNYYTVLCPEAEPFAYSMRSTVAASELPPYISSPVTDIMRANALQYLGDCFFEGIGLPEDAAAAVTCYRAVLDCAPKGTPHLPASVAEATYSLGWCLLHGVGTAADHQTAIRLLTSVSRTHPGACYTLGLCHEEGIGTVADNREAIKFYRKAQRLGHPEAEAKVMEVEKQLPERAG